MVASDRLILGEHDIGGDLYSFHGLAHIRLHDVLQCPDRIVALQEGILVDNGGEQVIVQVMHRAQVEVVHHADGPVIVGFLQRIQEARIDRRYEIDGVHLAFLRVQQLDDAVVSRIGQQAGPDVLDVAADAGESSAHHILEAGQPIGVQVYAGRVVSRDLSVRDDQYDGVVAEPQGRRDDLGGQASAGDVVGADIAEAASVV